MTKTKLNVVNNVLEKGVHYLQSPFGKRNFPKGTITQHNGVDLTGEGGTDWIVAVADGTVMNYKYTESRGYYVELKMENGYLTRYLHTKEGTCQVKVGNKVKKGQRLAFIGNTGYYKDAAGKKHRVGTHLHFAVVTSGGSFVDPQPYLEGKKNFKVWNPGKFKALKEKYLRKTPEVKATNLIKRNSLIPCWKAITKADKAGYAKLLVGSVVDLTEFKTDKKGNVWGKCQTNNTPLWICVKDKTGNQVKGV